MAIDGNALDSLAATLEDLTNRIGHLVESSGEDDEALAELREVERQLHSSTRRLAKVVRRLQR